ncbi:hypothetical protein Micbo1qcDRAFT_166492 [Microdochium bolleyi]|uniref:Uncharacterized protein n=1 Tax=Microdochium bolleyi TaxID=196109 RepID=A0A136IUG1_9PEZI|nr:hypothetical protein Micbo1qcDRAFT_166492 [Microdochium bolleyi]
MHTKPQLLTQLQLLAPGDRPRPVIDAYPSSAFAKTIMAPLLKRVPRIAGIKTELSVLDIMLVKSQDYAACPNDTDSDADDDNMKHRDLVAILSPLRTDDRAEIVMADGTVWVASPRTTSSQGCSYDFVSVGENGATLTARWARRRCASTSATSGQPPASPSQDYKYTFSIINLDCRRHPIMATLTPSSLEIFDSFTTVSQSSPQYPPTSPLLASPAASLSSGQEPEPRRRVMMVEEWQKNFIAISAIWVASRVGWSPDSRHVDTTSSPVTYSAPSSPLNTSSPVRKTSSPVLSIKKAQTMNVLDVPKRNSVPVTTPQPVDRSKVSILPKRATSTGAAFMQRRRAVLRADSGSSEDVDPSPGAIDKRPRRTLSGDWTGNMATGLGQHSLAAIALEEVDVPETPATAASLAPAPLPIMTTASVRAAAKPEQPTLWHNATTLSTGARSGSTTPAQPTTDGKVSPLSAAAVREGIEGKARHAKWKSITSWLSKLRSR